MDKGFIKIFRSIADHRTLRLCNDSFSIFIKILCRAKYKTEEFNGATMQPGEFITSYEKFAKYCNVSTQKMITKLKAFEKEMMIKRQSSRKGTKITVLNWERYQIENQKANEKQMKSKRFVTTIKEEKKERKKEVYTQKNFFNNPELNTWVGNIPKRTLQNWTEFGRLEVLEEIALEAKDWQEASGKKYKSIAMFLNNWFKKTDTWKEYMEKKKITEYFQQYLD